MLRVSNELSISYHEGIRLYIGIMYISIPISVGFIKWRDLTHAEERIMSKLEPGGIVSFV